MSWVADDTGRGGFILMTRDTGFPPLLPYSSPLLSHHLVSLPTMTEETEEKAKTKTEI